MILFGSEGGGKWDCVFSSLIASAKLHGIEPWTYIRDLLNLLPSWPSEHAFELSPKILAQHHFQVAFKQGGKSL